MAANLSITPLGDGRCYAEYVKIFHFEKTCMSVSREFPDAKYQGELNKDIAVLDTDSVTSYLMPAGNGCILFRKEVIEDARSLLK